jgi:hypothetical protein
MAEPTPVQILLGRLNGAVELVRAGDLAGALHAYERAFEPLPSGARVTPPPSLALDVLYRRADLLRRLDRARDAAALLDADETRAHARADAALAFELHLRRGEARAACGELETARHAFSDALRLVDVELAGDRERRLEAVHRLLDCVRAAADWTLLLTTARELVAWGDEIDDAWVVMEASLHVPHAYRGLGELEKARAHAQVIHDRMVELGQQEPAREWAEFLSSLPR